MNRLLLAAVLAAVAVALGWGFSVVGGPEHARKEQRDARRAADLMDLSQYYRCMKRDAPARTSDGAPIPCSVEGGAPDRTDPLTGEPYRHTETTEGRIDVCATFELDEDDRDSTRAYGVRFEGREGCVRVRHDGRQWVRE